MPVTTDYTWSYTDYCAAQWTRIGHMFSTENDKPATRSYVIPIKKNALQMVPIAYYVILSLPLILSGL